MKYRDRVDRAIMRFNQVTQNTVIYDPTKHSTHKDLIDLVDQFLLFQIYQTYTKYDSARIKCLSGN